MIDAHDCDREGPKGARSHCCALGVPKQDAQQRLYPLIATRSTNLRQVVTTGKSLPHRT
jgi:hypothetical protein